MRRDNPDGNAKEVRENLAKMGWVCVRIASAGQRKDERGIPDTLVARRPRRVTHLVEIKGPGGTLSAGQLEFIARFPGCVHVGRTSWEINLLLEECEARTK